MSETTERHRYQQLENVAVNVCVCGKWPMHHVHFGESPRTCGCDECRAQAALIRRFTVISPGCDGEGVQFSGGLVVVLWGEGNDTIDSYDDLAAYERLWPHHVITWIDDQKDAQGLALRRTYGEERHIVDLRDRGWTIQHPLSCRPRLFDCPVNKAAERDLLDPPAELGRFTCELGDNGRFKIGDRILDQPGDT